MSKAIAYILNPEKTDEKLLVSSYGCASETAAREFEWTRKIAEQKGMNPVRIIARHVIQSFGIGEVTPELAHEIGKQFADEILGGKYEYVLTTHIDKDHVHNHLIFNAVDFVDYTEQKKLAAEINKIGVNINTVCRRINSTGRFYQDDIDELKEKMDAVWQLLKSKQSEEL